MGRVPSGGSRPVAASGPRRNVVPRLGRALLTLLIIGGIFGASWLIYTDGVVPFVEGFQQWFGEQIGTREPDVAAAVGQVCS